MRIDHQLARRIERSDAEAGAAFAHAVAAAEKTSGACAAPFAGGIACYSGAGSPVNQALAVGLDGAVDAATFDQLEAFFFDRGEPAVFELCPFADPSLLGHLGERGYRPTEWSQVLFRAIGEGALPAGEEIAVAAARGDEGLLWSTLVARGFFDGGDPPGEVIRIMAAMSASATASAWIARLDGTPVGGGVVQVAQGVAILSGQSTLPAFRGRGVQAALIAAGLAHARTRGADVIAAMTLPGSGSQRNYERAGFRVAYSRMKVERAVPERWRSAS